MSNEYEQRMRVIANRLRDQGVTWHAFAPLIYRLAWRFGLRVRPPLYHSFAMVAIIQGVLFAILYGAMMWYWEWRAEGYSILRAVIIAVLTGTFFGCAMAFFSRRKTAHIRLPNLLENTTDEKAQPPTSRQVHQRG
jgi:hypothetical protein